MGLDCDSKSLFAQNGRNLCRVCPLPDGQGLDKMRFRLYLSAEV